MHRRHPLSLRTHSCAHASSNAPFNQRGGTRVGIVPPSMQRASCAGFRRLWCHPTRSASGKPSEVLAPVGKIQLTRANEVTTRSIVSTEAPGQHGTDAPQVYGSALLSAIKSRPRRPASTVRRAGSRQRRHLATGTQARSCGSSGCRKQCRHTVQRSAHSSKEFPRSWPDPAPPRPVVQAAVVASLAAFFREKLALSCEYTLSIVPHRRSRIGRAMRTVGREADARTSPSRPHAPAVREWASVLCTCASQAKIRGLAAQVRCSDARARASCTRRR